MQFDHALWARIESVRFDDVDAEFPFSARLARDNGWSRAFALRVVEEYRRFAYLAMRAGHEVTPSDEVDQAWHLHLTYTRHYWGAFTDALGAPLHHGPTAGGDNERARYADNYEATLRAYEAAFAERPPVDIWPAAHRRFAEAAHMRRISMRRNVVIRRGAFVAPLATLAGLGALSTALAAKAQESGASDLPPAVPIFAVIAIAIVIVALIAAAGGGKRKGKDGSGCAGYYGASDTGGRGGGKDATDGGCGASGCGGGGD